MGVIVLVRRRIGMAAGWRRGGGGSLICDE
jgi:hypothetical protein